MAKRNAINVLIKLLGGAEMTDELKKLGATGEAALEEIQTAANKVDLAKLGRSFDKLGKDLSTVGRRIGLAFAGIVTSVTAAAPAVIMLANAGSEAADEIGKAAQATGLQVDAYQRLAYAADQAGTSQERFASAMSNFNREIAQSAEKAGRSIGKLGRDIRQGSGFSVETFKDIGVRVTRFGEAAEGAGKKAAKGAKTAATAFEQLGIKVRDATGKLKAPEQLLAEVATAFQKMPDGALKSAAAVELFGEAGAELIPFLNKGAAGIRELGKEAADLGLIFTPEQIKAAEEYQDALGQLSATSRGLRNQVGLVFTPALTQAANAFRAAILQNRDAVLAFANGAVKTATVFVKDLIAALVGRDQDVENKWIVEWRDAIVQFGTDVTAVVNNVVIPAFELLRGAAQLVADGFNAIFGTEATAGQVALTAAIVGLVGGFTALGAAVGVVGAGIGALVTAIGGVPVAVGAAFLAGAAAAALFYDEIVAGAEAAWNVLIEGARLIWGDIIAAFEAGAMTASEAFDAIVASVRQKFDALVTGISQAFSRLDQLVRGIVNNIASAIKSTIGSAIDFISRQIDRLISAARTAAKAIRSAVGGGGSSSDKSTGFARGGRVHGPGTATSDSIPARLSVGEYVVNAKAVDHYGPGLFAALNSMRLPLDDLLAGFRRFSLGGLVDGLNRTMSMPRFAAGGMVGSFDEASLRPSRTVQVELKLGDTVYPMMTDAEVAGAMVRFARKQALFRAGRKPGRGFGY